jgi:biotin carboxylase
MKNNAILFQTQPLVILGGGVHQIPYAEYCKENNIPTIVIDQNKNAMARDYADLFLNIGTSNDTKVIEVINKYCQKDGIAGVLVAGVELAILGASISKYFKTKSIDIMTAINATNKIIRAEKFKEFGIPAAKFEIVDSIHSVSLNYPYVIKKQEGSGSRGVRVISSKDDLLSAYEDFEGNGNLQYLVEEFICGHEISIEAFIHKGEFYYYCFAVRDIETISNGKIIEYGSISDPLYDDKNRNKVKKVFESACLALGIEEGPAKGDILYTKSGPKVLEVASRSAPLAPLISERIYGIDMVSMHVKWVLGLDFVFKSLPVAFSKSKPVSHRILSHKPGVLKSIIGIDEAKKSEGVLEIIVLKDLNFPMKLDYPDNNNRILYVAATGCNAIRARENADNALSKINLIYK